MSKKVIGIRVTPSNIYYAILEKNEEEISILSKDKVIVPKALNLIEKLSYLRTSFFSIFNEYEIVNASLKKMESTSVTGSNEQMLRMNIEGVLLELLGNSSVEKYFIGTNSSIANKLSVKIDVLKEYVEGISAPFDHPNWKKEKKEIRESLITAYIALEL